VEPHHIYSFDGVTPRIHPRAHIHPSACIIGDVDVGEACFIGPHATLRGDNGLIRLDAGSNVQDNCVLHSRPGGRRWSRKALASKQAACMRAFRRAS
jgi:phenylacetic acid degradation protein